MAIKHHKKFKEEVEHKLRSKPVLWVRVILLVVCVAAFIFLLATKSIESAMAFGFALSMFLFFYLWVFITTVEKICMMKDIQVGKLTEGDWILGDVLKGKKVIVKQSKTGITLQQIALLKKKGVKTVKVKVGIPFVPSFVLAYIVTMIAGNWIAGLI